MTNDISIGQTYTDQSNTYEIVGIEGAGDQAIVVARIIPVFDFSYPLDRFIELVQNGEFVLVGMAA